MVRNEQILKDILLKMNYDLSKSLNENIEEQESSFTRNLDRIYSRPDTAREFNQFVIEHKHTLLDIASIGAFFIPVVGPILSLGLELANAGLYYSEGDDYMAGFSLAFSLIPGGELFAKIPAIKKLGRNGLADIIKKVRMNRRLTKDEMEVFQKIVKESDWISKTAKLNASILVNAQKILKSATLKDLVYLIYRFSKRYPRTFNLTKLGLTIGGVFYTFEKLAEIYNLKPSEESSPDITDEDEEIVITDYDRSWDYKKIGDKYYTKKKNSDKWILTSGSVKDAIKTKVFKDTTNVVNPDKLENEYQENKTDVNAEYYDTILSMTDTAKLNEFWSSREY
jgi:hypothetical protein